MIRKNNSKTSWTTVHDQIYTALPLREEFAALGIEIVGAEPNAGGWISARAIGREDDNPSAAVNLECGRYKDMGGEGVSLSLFDLAVHLDKFDDWKAARKHYAKKAGVKLPGGREEKDPAHFLKFRPWNDKLAELFCNAKPGINRQAIRDFGGRIAKYRNYYNVIAFPIFGAELNNADPVGYVLYQLNGHPLPVYQGKSKEPARWVKMKTTSGSKSGLMGPFCSPIYNQNANVSIKTEGPADALALWSSMPAQAKISTIVATNANGASETPKEAMAGPFVGTQAVIIHDADKPGQAGAIKKWIPWLQEIAREVRHVCLPYEVVENHGKDIRDFLTTDGGTFKQLWDMAVATKPVGPGSRLTPDQSNINPNGPANDGGHDDDGDIPPNDPRPSDADSNPDSPQITEADDDPYRLARIYLRLIGSANDRLTLRYWRQGWYRWKDGKYREILFELLRSRVSLVCKEEFDRIHLEEIACQMDSDEKPVAKKVTNNLVTNVIGALAGICAIDTNTDGQPLEFNQWIKVPSGVDSSHGYLALENGILDIEAFLGVIDKDDLSRADIPKFLLPHSPEWFSTVKLPFAFDLSATCPTWQKVLDLNLESDQDRILLLQQWSGYCLTYDTDQQKFLLLIGNGGNGKSVYIAGLEAVIGQANVSHVPLEQFGSRFQLTEALGKLVNVAGDTDDIERIAEGQLKEFTAGSVMSFDRKNKSVLSAKPTARLVVAANQYPRFRDKTEGIARRIIVVPFSRRVRDEERVLGMDKPPWWERSGELPGILLWALIGLRKFRDAGRFIEPEACIKAKEEQRTNQSSAREFLKEHVVVSSLVNINCEDLYRKFREWYCKGHNEKFMPHARSFNDEIRNLYSTEFETGAIQKKQRGAAQSRKQFWSGIDLTDDLFEE